ncbi:MAG: uroporphyrinogen decarboxylase family protein [Spirochaetaceae bacterium]
MTIMTKREAVLKILNREDPGRFVYAPNYWQWFTHQKNHGLLPEEIAHCREQLDCINYLGLDVFSRNTYSDPVNYWFGGLTERVFDNVKVEKEVERENGDTVITLKYTTPKGSLEERLRYIFNDSTLVQEKHLVDDPETQLDIFEDLISRISYRFLADRYDQEVERIGENGLPMAGEFFSPLKMMHIYLGPVETTYQLTDREERFKPILQQHEESQLKLLQEMLDHGVLASISMDNLDAMFHPPQYVEAYSASFYERASRMSHEKGSTFFIHACGQQKANLELISSLGVDGLEGVAYPPLGDVELDEAMKMTGDRFIITGGISAAETSTMEDRESIFAYTKDLFRRMEPYRNRFMFSASCNTAIDTPWETIKLFKEAWEEYGT